MQNELYTCKKLLFEIRKIRFFYLNMYLVARITKWLDGCYTGFIRGDVTLLSIDWLR